MLHVYWAFGGNWAIEYAMPEEYKADYFSVEHKTKITAATLIVAIGLLVFSIVTAANHFDIGILLVNDWASMLTKVIAFIFLFRAMGDFNLFGLFKKKANSKFAIKDSQLYIPLCIYLGISSILISI